MIDHYKFVGVVNLFNLYPDFLFPVYEKDNNLYFHNGSIDAIKDFDPLSDSAKNRVVFLDNECYHIINSLKKSSYSQYSSPVYAFQESENVILCLDPDDMINYFRDFKTDDKILEKNISLFVQEYTLSKIYKSLQYYTSLTETENNSFIEKRSYRHNYEQIGYLGASYCFDKSFENFSYANNSHSRQEVEKEFFAPALTYNFNHIIDQSIPQTLKRLAHSLDVLSASHICFAAIMPIIDELSSMQNALKAIQIFGSNNISQINAFSVSQQNRDTNDYCIAKNLQKNGADFSRLRLSFDYVIKRLSPMSEFYEICINCQNSVINKDEDHLLQTINRHLLMFQAMQRKKFLDDYLVEYIQNHTNETDYINIDEIKNTQN